MLALHNSNRLGRSPCRMGQSFRGSRCRRSTFDLLPTDILMSWPSVRHSKGCGKLSRHTRLTTIKRQPGIRSGSVDRKVLDLRRTQLLNHILAIEDFFQEIYRTVEVVGCGLIGNG